MRVKLSAIFALAVLPALFSIPQWAKAQTWNANVGAETKDQGVQADAFLPNEMWIYKGDSVTWKFVPKTEIHTLTILKTGQVRPPFAGPPNVAGCPPPPSGVQPSGTSFDGSACVNSGVLAGGATYTVKFTNPGNYKLECLVHPDMVGVIHVLPLTATLPHNQGFYDDQGQDQAEAILSDKDGGHDEDEDRGDHGRRRDSSVNRVVAGTGEIVATGGGRQYRAVVRFLAGTITIHVGESVEWTNLDPTEPHTVTFGTEPAIPQTPVNVIPTIDGTLVGTINSASDSVSGFLGAEPQGHTGLPEPAPGTTRMRITFTHAGTFNYICALHDEDGMVGKVIVK